MFYTGVGESEREIVQASVRISIKRTNNKWFNKTSALIRQDKWSE